MEVGRSHRHRRAGSSAKAPERDSRVPGNHRGGRPIITSRLVFHCSVPGLGRSLLGNENQHGSTQFRMTWTALLFFVAYMALFLVTVFTIARIGRLRRRTRRPLPDNYKLLRMPGEYLWRRMAEADSDSIEFLAALMVPISVGFVVLKVGAHFFPTATYSVLSALALTFLIAFGFSIWWLVKRLNRQDNDYLGFFGERYVAELLEPLKVQGWAIFHDLQCSGAVGKFNIDHVAVGPGGVWVVETKTRRKGKARSGGKDYEVVFDGQQLIWPWGKDTVGLQQALNNARWLQEWLEKMTGQKVSVASVLTFPGWLITERQLGPVRVVNPKGLPQVVTSRGRNVLAPDVADLIRRQLEQLCRDVEY